MTDLPLFAPRHHSYEKARQIIRGLPPLPSSIRYLDEYDDEVRSVRNPEGADKWELLADTQKKSFNFTGYDEDIKFVLKHFYIWALSKQTVVSADLLQKGLRSYCNRFGIFSIFESIERPILEWSVAWTNVIAPQCNFDEARFHKNFLMFMCDLAIGDFRPHHHNFVKSLPFQWNDHYQGVLTGEAVITIDQERAIITYLDDVARDANENPETVPDERLTKACLLCISYQHGLRPIQIIRIDRSDLRLYDDNNGQMIVHVTAYRAKKKHSSDKTPFTRRIKPDWAPLFVEYKKRRDAGPVWKNYDGSSSKLFTITKSVLITAIGDVVEFVIGERSTATILRHSGAQRLADSGASVEEVAEYLGHSNPDTSLVYFESSPSQAERVNRAMALSGIYNKIAEIASSGVIDKAELLGLPDDNQIHGMPHGIPISGIGACNLGQSLCAKHPVLSCYGCRKFIPVSDMEIHRQALEDLRSVVRFFFDEARGGLQSQAYTQLTSTLEAIQSVVIFLENGDHGGIQ